MSDLPGPLRLSRIGLLAASAAGTAGLLLVAPGAGPDRTFPLLLVALVPLVALVVAEHRHPTLSSRTILAVAGGVLALAVVRPLHGSQDAWSYAMYGRTVAHYHVSPYTHRPSDFPGDPVLARVAPGWRAARSVYGPGFTVLSAAIMAVAGTSAVVARVGFQGVAALSLLGAGILLARRRVPAAILVAVMLNPLLVVEVANGGHNDALVGLAVLAAALALGRRRFVAAGLLLAAAILVKPIAGFAAVACVAWVWEHEGPHAARAAGAAVGGPVLVGYLVFGGVRAVAPVIAAASRWSRASVWDLLPLAHSSLASDLALVTVAGLTAALVATRLRDRSAPPVLVASLAGYLLVAAYVLPWYLAWALPVAALDGESALARILAVQSVALLVAYQYRANPGADGLDRMLHTAVSGAQAVSLVAAVVVLALAVAHGRSLWSASRA